MHGHKKSPVHKPPIKRAKIPSPFDSDKKAPTSSNPKSPQSVQELESYAVYKSEETTKTIDNCLRIGEEIRGDATKILSTLHQQGEQITRTHDAVTDIDRHLTRGEKLLGSLGGIFSKRWKPKTRNLSGPVNTTDHGPVRHPEQKEKPRLESAPKPKSRTQTQPPEPTNAFQRVEYEKAKQDEALSDLSNLLGELKDMATDMNRELDGHNEALKPLDKDVEVMAIGVEKANQRGKWLLAK
ncbi:hypothetical protein V2J09_016917 [Rumex salicifolius]